MRTIVIASAEEERSAPVLEKLARSGHAADLCTSWSEAVVLLTRPETRLFLLDAELPGASSTLLAEIERALDDPPVVRTLGAGLEGIASIDDDAHLSALAAQATPPLLEEWERQLLDFVGVGPQPLDLFERIAANPQPVHFEGERGSGKEWVARIVHRLTGVPGPFVNWQPGAELTVHGSTPGTVFLENVDMWTREALDEAVAFALATGWRVMGGGRPRSQAAHLGIDWAHIRLQPLRDRPRDVRPLARTYLHQWSARLGLPRRRVHAKLWKLIEAYHWPGNQRELETFIVQAATSARGVVLSTGTLPHHIVALLDPVAREARATLAFEEMVEKRLRPIVTQYAPLPDAPGLHRMVIDATERALVRLALHRTGGNQKAAARVLGVARNTLRTRMAAMAPWEEEE